MPRLNGIIHNLQAHRAAAQATVDQLDRAIDALAGLAGKAPGRWGGVRHMSKAARKRIADAQRARWARVKAAKGGPGELPGPFAKKRRISAAGRKRIAEAAKARWGRVRAEKAKNA